VRSEFFARGRDGLLRNQLSPGLPLPAGPRDFFAPECERIHGLSHPAAFAATSYYDTEPLKATLERLVDFDRINAARRASASAP